jgi:hypothetical protein
MKDIGNSWRRVEDSRKKERKRVNRIRRKR